MVNAEGDPEELMDWVGSGSVRLALSRNRSICIISGERSLPDRTRKYLKRPPEENEGNKPNGKREVHEPEEWVQIRILERETQLEQICI